MKTLALCDGISCGLMALDKIGRKTEYHAVEIDKFCRKISDSNFSDKNLNPRKEKAHR